ncbi:MAG: MBL fold metallo-hydrolase [Candidatus Bathyarchaeota archaeon]|nr:MBL fold metallo-hydrolase [Candidatus Bathyarchaeota archaeon]
MSSKEDVGIPGSRYAYVKGVSIGDLTKEDWLKACFPEWGTWLNKRIEKTKVKDKSVALWWTGACGFFIKTKEANLIIDQYSGPSLYTSFEDGCGVCRQSGAERIEWLRTFPHVIDPWEIKELDVILITHFHPDHCDPYAVIPMLKKTTAKFIGPELVCSKLKEFGVPENRIIKVKWGSKVKVKDTEILATETADRTLLFSGKQLPKDMEEGAVCYLIKTPAGNIFHNGDSHYANMFYRIGKEHKVDVALLQFGQNPPGVTDKMTTHDAYRVAEALDAKLLIPMHYDWANMQGDPTEIELLVKRNAPWIKTAILQPGCKFEYPTDVDIGKCKYPQYVERWRPELSWEYGDKRKMSYQVDE